MGCKSVLTRVIGVYNAPELWDFKRGRDSGPTKSFRLWVQGAGVSFIVPGTPSFSAMGP